MPSLVRCQLPCAIAPLLAVRRMVAITRVAKGRMRILILSVGSKPDFEQSRPGQVDSIVDLVAVPSAHHCPTPLLERAFLDAQELRVFAGGRLVEREAQADV